ncbi:unnamed protein product [Pseudo-nitzschia multistriata]|uniref:Uncharacterized protein n=1 Tax=Pseudo-nitzschia multistriata TaxID=183589 RepID=A0A448YY55_9STRA|nr:unnamed protein product [Pseudo-nitzschia multistriata]
MPPPLKSKETPLDDGGDNTLRKEDINNSNGGEATDEDDEDESDELALATSPTAVANGGNTVTKLRCLNCWRVARKDCTGSLCIRCCTDETCTVHNEQRAKLAWKKAVTLGTTDLQKEARAKRARKIPKGRFKEEEFSYMHDTVVLWDLRSVLEPAPPRQNQAPSGASRGQLALPSAATTTTATAQASASAGAEYLNQCKVREEILRRSRKNNSAAAAVEGRPEATKVRRNYKGTKKRFRRLMEDLYQRSLALN